MRPLTLACCGLSGHSLAADGANHLLSRDYSTVLSQILLGLLLVLALIAALTYLLKRLPRRLVSGGQIRLLESYPLSPRERLLLVSVGGEHILLSQSNVGIQPLHVLREPLPATTQSEVSRFAAQLAKVVPSLQRGSA